MICSLPDRVWNISTANVGLKERSVKLTAVEDVPSFGVENANDVLTRSHKHNLRAS